MCNGKRTNFRFLLIVIQILYSKLSLSLQRSRCTHTEALCYSNVRYLPGPKTNEGKLIQSLYGCSAWTLHMQPLPISSLRYCGENIKYHTDLQWLSIFLFACLLFIFLFNVSWLDLSSVFLIVCNDQDTCVNHFVQLDGMLSYKSIQFPVSFRGHLHEIKT